MEFKSGVCDKAAAVSIENERGEKRNLLPDRRVKDESHR